MKDGQANVPVGLEKADEVPARLHSTAGVVLGLTVVRGAGQ